MSWCFYNAAYDIDDPHTCGLTLLEAAVVPSTFIIPSSFVLVSPNAAWRPFNPSDNHRIRSSNNAAVGHRRQLFKVEGDFLRPIYWDLNVKVQVHKADWVFTSSMTPLPPSWELVAAALLEQVKPWTDEYAERFEKAQATGDFDPISAKISIDKTTKNAGRLLFSPAPKETPKGHILSLYQSKSARFISEWSTRFGQTVEIGLFDYGVYREKYKIPARPSDEIDFVPDPVSKLTLVVHGIGQKLPTPMEKRNFTFAVEKLRSRIRKEYEALGETDDTLLLPVIWRHAFKVENSFVSPDAIRPPFMTELRDKFNNFMYDIPYYMSSHRDIMINATCEEANRIFQLFKHHHPYFEGPVNMIGHSLGSVIAADILSKQPTECSPEAPLSFNVNNFYTCGSPLGFFLYLRNSPLIPRSRFEGEELPEFGCLAVNQIFNVIHPYDFVASLLSPTVRGGAEGLEPAQLPAVYGDRRVSRSRLSSLAAKFQKPPSEKPDFEPSDDMLALNVNGQLDWIIQYSSHIELYGALTAHTNYWINSDFARLLIYSGRGKVPELKAKRVE